MIDKQNGDIKFDNDILISKKLLKTDFLNSKLKDLIKPSIINDPWFSYSISDLKINNLRFSTTLFFNNEQLYMVVMSIIDNDNKDSWSNWSEEKELHRKKENDIWLNKMIQDNRVFDWGVVESIYDSRSASSIIVFKYK